MLQVAGGIESYDEAVPSGDPANAIQVPLCCVRVLARAKRMAMLWGPRNTRASMRSRANSTGG